MQSWTPGEIITALERQGYVELGSYEHFRLCARADDGQPCVPVMVSTSAPHLNEYEVRAMVAPSEVDVELLVADLVAVRENS